MHFILYYFLGTEQAVSILSDRVSQINVQRRFMVDDNAWPPEQPAGFTPLLLIHYKDHRTPEQVKAMAELTCSGNIDLISVKSDSDYPDIKRARLDSQENFQKAMDTVKKATKEIEEILAPLEKGPSFILIEGAPGIGKSCLLKEIAYRWGYDKQLLKRFEFVLLVCLRDPSLQKINSLSDLLHLFYKGDENATEIINACSQYLSKDGGKNLTLLLDGYDEYPSHLQENSLISKILKRWILPYCGLVISSRPHASKHLRKQADIRVDILGFTETERENYIKQALQDQPDKIKELTQYLHQQPSIDSACYIPFNMFVLLYLYKQGIHLPKNSTELCHHFIFSTIYCHLSKLGKLPNKDISDLADLPEPYNRVIKQLSKLSMEAANIQKLTFTLEEVKDACPDVANTPGGINGFGLLQAVPHFNPYTKTITLNFMHFTVQEFLAAHYISHLPPNEELKVIEANFWNKTHLNIFAMYMSLTNGQQPSFKKFLSGGNEAVTISPEFLKDQLKCLRLYSCFNEANDHAACNTIECADVFNSKEITLWGITLTATDIECISVFLTSSFNKEWMELNLRNCSIQDRGLNILYRGLRHSKDVTINKLWLGFNALTVHSSSLISELTVNCKVKDLVIANNHSIGEDHRLYSMLTSQFTALAKLHMRNIDLTSRAAIALFAAIRDNKTLKELEIGDNAVDHDACDAITTMLKSNRCLIALGLDNNLLSSETIVNIVECLKVNNNVLQYLRLPDCPQSIQKTIKSLQEIVNENRKSLQEVVNENIKGQPSILKKGNPLEITYC